MHPLQPLAPKLGKRFLSLPLLRWHHGIPKVKVLLVLSAGVQELRASPSQFAILPLCSNIENDKVEVRMRSRCRKPLGRLFKIGLQGGAN